MSSGTHQQVMAMMWKPKNKLIAIRFAACGRKQAAIRCQCALPFPTGWPRFLRSTFIFAMKIVVLLPEALKNCAHKLLANHGHYSTMVIPRSTTTPKIKSSGQECPPPHTNPMLLFFFFFRGDQFMFEDLKGRTAVVFGVANKRSIAWAIAQGLHAAGANLAITYQNPRLELEAKDLILSLPGAEAFMCDVSDDAAIAGLFEKLKERYGKLHVLVHSIGFAPAKELKGDFVNTSREGFRIAHDISVYSLIALSRAAAPLMQDGGSILTLTYHGSTKVVPRYNVMGVAKA